MTSSKQHRDHTKDETNRSSFATSPTRLYRIPQDGKMMGVCAGIADYFGICANIVRVLTVLGMFTPFNWLIFIGYFILGFALDKKPYDLYEDEQEEQFWRETRKAPDYSASDMHRRFHDIEKRTRDMEAYMTSKRFKLERELKALED